MFVRELRTDLSIFLKKHSIKKKFDKQIKILVQNPRHPSLNTEILEPKKLKIYSFRIDKKYRVIFIFTDTDEIEIIDINDHYQY